MSRELAENLWEELGGDLCVCQRPDVPHWCESCQRRIGLILDTFGRVSASPSPSALAIAEQVLRRAASELRDAVDLLGYQGLITVSKHKVAQECEKAAALLRAGQHEQKEQK